MEEDFNTSLSRISSQESQSANKENAPPLQSASDRAEAASSRSIGPRRESDRIKDVHSRQSEQLPTLSSVRKTLTTSFAKVPPHTVQRLAELILRPRSHYRFVGPYLRAIDRVISVSSGADTFPLAGERLPEHGGNSYRSNGVASSWNTMLDGDDSLGGALLTPISWLQSDNEAPDEMQSEPASSPITVNGVNSNNSKSPTESSSGPLPLDRGISPSSSSSPSSSPSNAHMIESDPLLEPGAVTQGQLLRQEQESGVLPTPEPTGRHARSAAAARSTSPDEPDDHHPPHPGGPDEIGVEDMGPQDPGDARGRFDVDVALGRRAPPYAADITMSEDDDINDDGDGGRNEA